MQQSCYYKIGIRFGATEVVAADGTDAVEQVLRSTAGIGADLVADCDTPLGAHALPGPGGELVLRAWVGLPDGSAWTADQLTGELPDPQALGRAVAERLRSVGAEELLQSAREAAVDGP